MILFGYNTFYTKQKTLVIQNVECLDRCLQADPRRVVDMVVDVSTITIIATVKAY